MNLPDIDWNVYYSTNSRNTRLLGTRILLRRDPRAPPSVTSKGLPDVASIENSANITVLQETNIENSIRAVPFKRRAQCSFLCPSLKVLDAPTVD